MYIYYNVWVKINNIKYIHMYIEERKQKFFLCFSLFFGFKFNFGQKELELRLYLSRYKNGILYME